MRLPSGGGIVVVLLTGGTLRVVQVLSYEPALLNYPDTWGYIRAAAGPLFHHDDVRPVGYALVLRTLHGVWPTVQFVVGTQHLLGMGSAFLVYATLRRLGQARWTSILPAVVVAISPDFLYFEHSLLSESTFCFLLLALLYAVVRGLALSGDSAFSRRIVWFALAGGLLGAAMTVRSSGAFLVPPLTLALMGYGAGRWRAKLLGGTVFFAAVTTVFGAYLAARAASVGGLDDMGAGWALYGRAAPFADCRRFQPPEGTRGLCQPEGTPRFGGDYYGWQEGSPARRIFIGPPFHDDEVGAFGRAAIRAQPADYLEDVLRDIWRFIDPDAGSPPLHSGAGPEALAVDARDEASEALNSSVAEPYYGSIRIRVGQGARILADLQPTLRFGGPLIVVAVVLALAALPFSKGRERVALVLFGTTLVIPVLSVATSVYNWRYLVPVLPELAASGSVGAAVLVRLARNADEAQGAGGPGDDREQ